MTRIIKKYPNRRLYDTESSTYITLQEVKGFVLKNEAFKVQDPRTGEDLTRAILLQIILDEESGGVPMFSADMLANIIRYYGHSMQGLMGSYLERSINAFHEAQSKFQEQAKTLYDPQSLAKAVPLLNPEAWNKIAQDGAGAVPQLMADYIGKSTADVIGMQEELRRQAIQMFSTFPYLTAPAAEKNADKKLKRTSAAKPARATAKPRANPKAGKASSK